MSTKTFLKNFVRDPVTLGAVAPSSKKLAKLMVDAAEVQPGHSIVELGAGTGPMTAEILHRCPDSPLLVLEPKAELAAALRARFPDLEIQERFAQDLPELMESWGHGPVNRVISSLPWAIWPTELQEEILSAILEVLAPEGRMVTFTYWHAQPLPAAKRFKATLLHHFSQVERTRVEWINLPPAFVFVCDR